MKAVIVHDRVPADAPPDERDALVQADAVSEVLRSLGYSVTCREFTLNMERLRGELSAESPDLLFNLVESVEGEGRLIHLAPALFESLGIPFTGAGSAATFTSANKLIAKRLMRSAGIATPDWIEERAREGEAASGRFIIKSVWEHASRGLGDDSLINAEPSSDVRGALVAQRGRLGGEGFAERFIDGREFNLSLLARGDRSDAAEVLPPAELVFEGFGPERARIVGYAAKWDEDSFEYRNTHRRFEFPVPDGALIARLRADALRCWELFGVRGYARVDFRVDAQGIPWVLEVNTNPCLSPDAGFAAAVDRAGIGYKEAVRRIVQAALNADQRAPVETCPDDTKR